MESLKLNSGLALLNSSKVSSDAREQLVMEGQALVLESVGMAKNKALSTAQRPTVDFGSSFKSASDYEKYARKWTDDVLHFCAKKVNDFNGTRTSRDEKATFTDPRLAANPMYLQLMSSVMNDVLYTTTPYVVNELVGDMVSTVTTPKGQTYTAGITSNAVFQWYDTTWTSLRSVPEDQLYHKTIALNPTPRACRGRINYYQMVGNGLNMVDTLAALAGGYGAMIMRIFTDAFTKAAADTTYVPAALTATGYTDQNWAKIVQNVAKANRVRRTDIIGYGNFLALRKVLPDNTGLASAIMMQLGNEYFRNGYITSHDGTMLYEITPTSTPDTINTTMDDVFPSDMIVLAARATERYAPMICCFEEGGQGMLNLTPGDDVIATGNIEVEQFASLDIAPAFASRIGIISSVV